MKVFRRYTLVSILALLIQFMVYIVVSWHASSYYTMVGVPVLNYHMVNDKHMSPLVMRVGDFEGQMQYLHDHGYHTITCDQLYDYMTEGKPLPDKPVLITFDDGYEDNYKVALPIMERFGMKATLFMIADSVGKKRFLTADQLRDMDQRGFEIQTHTFAHTYLTNMSPEAAEADLIHSRRVLEDIVGHPVRYLAYPGGFQNEAIQEAAKRAGIRMAFTVHPNYDIPGDDLMALPRLAIFEGINSYNLFVLRLHLGNVAHRLSQLRHYLRDHGLGNWVPYLPYI